MGTWQIYPFLHLFGKLQLWLGWRNPTIQRLFFVLAHPLPTCQCLHILQSNAFKLWVPSQIEWITKNHDGHFPLTVQLDSDKCSIIILSWIAFTDWGAYNLDLSLCIRIKKGVKTENQRLLGLHKINKDCENRCGEIQVSWSLGRES